MRDNHQNMPTSEIDPPLIARARHKYGEGKPYGRKMHVWRPLIGNDYISGCGAVWLTPDATLKDTGEPCAACHEVPHA